MTMVFGNIDKTSLIRTVATEVWLEEAKERTRKWS